MFGLRLLPPFLQPGGDAASGEGRSLEPTKNESDKDAADPSDRGRRDDADSKLEVEVAEAAATPSGDPKKSKNKDSGVEHGDEPQGNYDEDAAPPEEEVEEEKPVKLYKSPRLKGYITIVLAAGIHFNSVQRSATSNQPKVVPSTPGQRRYGLAVCTVDMVLATVAVLCHLDRVTPLERFWISAFRPKSRVELLLALFLAVWNVIATGVETSVGGIAGDGKGQYNIYFSVWILCLTSFWVLERWWVDYGWSSFRSFITSWPYRAPAWICIMFLSLLVMIFSLDLWQNYGDLDPNNASAALDIFQQVPLGQWQWYVTLTVFTLCPAVAFVAIELFRDTNDDGSTQEKTKLENVVEGVVFLLLVLAWIPTVGAVTTPNGAASLIGNCYFFTWMLVVFLFEGLIWWIHDYRFEIHEALRAKEREYRRHQRDVLAKTRQIQLEQQNLRKDESEDGSSDDADDRNILPVEPPSDERPPPDRERLPNRERTSTATEYFDAAES